MILVEDEASGQSLIQELRYETVLPISPVKVDRDKMCEGPGDDAINRGREGLPAGVRTVDCGLFGRTGGVSNGVHDDIVDSVTSGSKLSSSSRAIRRGDLPTFTGVTLQYP